MLTELYDNGVQYSVTIVNCAL